MAYDERLAERCRLAMAGRPDVVEKHMFGGLAFMVRGHMACGIVGSTLMVRLPPETADGLLTEPHVRPMDFTGRPMRGFLYVDPPGIKAITALQKWIDRAAAYAEAQPRKVRPPAHRKTKRKEVKKC